MFLASSHRFQGTETYWRLVTYICLDRRLRGEKQMGKLFVAIILLAVLVLALGGGGCGLIVGLFGGLLGLVGGLISGIVGLIVGLIGAAIGIAVALLVLIAPALIAILIIVGLVQVARAI
jgi:hypothetical protein